MRASRPERTRGRHRQEGGDAVRGVAVWPDRAGATAAAAIAGARTRAALLAAGESGTTTSEYAIATIAAAAFGALLYTVVTGGSITEALTGIIEKALETSVG